MNEETLHKANKLTEEIKILEDFIETIYCLEGKSKLSGITIKLTGRRWYGIGTIISDVDIPHSMYEEIKAISNKRLAQLKKQYELLS